MVLFALIGGGCRPSEGNLRQALATATFDFNSSVRWKRYQVAAEQLDPSIRGPFLTRMEENDEHLQISMVEALRLELFAKQGKAVLRYRFHWHRANEGILKKTVVVQEWRRRGDHWKLAKLTHGSGPRFPLFERLEPPRRRARPTAPPATKRKAPPAR
jgi:hypothetical protein